jgi:hypothetical protein
MLKTQGHTLKKLINPWPQPERLAGEQKQGQWFVFFSYRPKAL